VPAFPYQTAFAETAMTTGAYMIVIATLERYLLTAQSRCINVVRNHRLVWVTTSFVVAVVFKASKMFEFEVEVDGNLQNGETPFKNSRLPHLNRARIPTGNINMVIRCMSLCIQNGTRTRPSTRPGTGTCIILYLKWVRCANYNFKYI
jgi:hypothetical protein